MAAINNEVFKQFIIHKSELPSNETGIKYGVIYTRVSTKEQFLHNGSIETQKKMCLRFAEQNDIPILQEFGGCYESAKSEERKEFKRMMEFVKNSKQSVKFIIVSDNDRFSRTGANAIYIAEQLRNKGIQIKATSSPVDTLTPIGAFQQDMQLMFSKFDNQMRKEKCSRGMKQKYEKGICFGCLPTGYEKTMVDGKPFFKANELGKAIGKAFRWKAEQNISIAEIEKRLKKLGTPVSEKRLSAAFRNVFYCGLLSNKMLGDKLVEGVNWEPVVSKEMFLKTNQILQAQYNKFDSHKEAEQIPLKRLVYCDKCYKAMTGYMVKKKGIYYYKCSTKGCCSNKSADKMNQEFEQLLKRFEIHPKYTALIETKLEAAISKVKNEQQEKATDHIKRKHQILEKMEQMEERYVTGEIKQDLYEKYRAKFTNELNEVLKEIQPIQPKLSNSNLSKEKMMEYSLNISKMWASGDLWERQTLQKIVFPDKIYYNCDNSHYRTEKVNSIIHENARLSKVFSQLETKNPSRFERDSQEVDLPGFEPGCRQRRHKPSTYLVPT
ncbi:MAG: hypothetical protein RL065_2100 [Bacteroidota bacterium]